MKQKELYKIVEQHQHWLKEDCEGWKDMNANLRRANLRRANLSGELKTYGMDDPEVGDEYEMYKVSEVDAVLSEKDAEIRRLRRALWRAIALFCARSCEYFNGIMSHCLMGQDDLYKRCEEKKNKYLHAMYKCRAKAEEYK